MAKKLATKEVEIYTCDICGDEVKSYDKCDFCRKYACKKHLVFIDLFDFGGERNSHISADNTNEALYETLLPVDESEFAACSDCVSNKELQTIHNLIDGLAKDIYIEQKKLDIEARKVGTKINNIVKKFIDKKTPKRKAKVVKKSKK